MGLLAIEPARNGGKTMTEITRSERAEYLERVRRKAEEHEYRMNRRAVSVARIAAENPNSK